MPNVDLSPDSTVVVSTLGGSRFHRPNDLGFKTACKIDFDYPVRELTLNEAIDEGFTPCEKVECFGVPDL